MSPHAANSLVHDLVQMAQAMERLPQIERDLANAHDAIRERNTYIDAIALDLEQSRTYAASLEQKVHTLEVARDDAELAFLEADERTSRALDFIKATFGNAGTLIQALEPVKIAPQADSPSDTLTRQAEAHIADHGEGVISLAAQLDSHPVGESESPLSDPSLPSGSSNSALNTPSESHSSQTGQREPDPTVSATSLNPSNDLVGKQESVEAQVSVFEEPATAPGPYHGHNYYDWPSYVELDRWIAGGGTEWDYYNRRTA